MENEQSFWPHEEVDPEMTDKASKNAILQGVNVLVTVGTLGYYGLQLIPHYGFGAVSALRDLILHPEESDDYSGDY